MAHYKRDLYLVTIVDDDRDERDYLFVGERGLEKSLEGFQSSLGHVIKIEPAGVLSGTKRLEEAMSYLSLDEEGHDLVEFRVIE